MREPCFGALRMKGPGSHPRAGRHAHRHIHRLPPAVMCLRKVVGDLIEAGGDEVGELHLHHRRAATDRQAECTAKYRRFAEGSIAYALPAELLDKALGDL